MSAEQQPADDPPSITEQPLDPRPGVELAFESSISNSSTEPAASGQPADSSESLPVRIERTYLRTRVAALERELEASEDRRQAIITQYERVLEGRREDVRDEAIGRDNGPDESDTRDNGPGESDARSIGPVKRLVDGLR
ncbi:hypothetical protein [Natrarchaeobius chitinivorans]|uniref:Uncharacterized protein n=1 Tax=Natrarchaeobius chitinivorans TaxID=1679083 RepID=A0A3N6MG19_NATCH|nr:hypothetical protein [Natrarchaeobius chitinivorans]RQG94551.1 hypothetical protein EA473_10710 [Natrarchaeobius chitinivorans]